MYLLPQTLPEDKMQGSDPTAQVRAELQQIMPLVSKLTGLPARWSGRVELVIEADFKGKKRFGCDIQIAADLAEQDTCWATLIHESLHCHSAGYNGTDYRKYRGWEEGVVEQLQRLLRPQLLLTVGVTVEEAVFSQSGEFHRYNRYVRVLENLRLAVPQFAEEPEEFYKTLLATPIRDRIALALSWRDTLPFVDRVEFVGNFSTANYELTRGIV